jgi:steroid 5-alpha reductase family enzyme
MKLEVFRGDLGQGYFYQIADNKGEAIALGYYRLEKHANYWGELALSIYEREGKR